MAKYRKKPVVIEAVELQWATWGEMCAFAGVGRLADGKPEGCYVDSDGVGRASPMEDSNTIGLHIPTLEGLMLARQGDFVIRGVKGELYPCKPDIFAATYEAVE